MDRNTQHVQEKKIWRRKENEALLTPGLYAQMLATRVESQVTGDWMLVPAAPNLHWRYEVLLLLSSHANNVWHRHQICSKNR